MPPAPAAIRAALVDLDGTLLDTAADLAAAANATLEGLGLAPVAPVAVRDFIGKGVSFLVRRCLETSLGRAPEPRLMMRAEARFRKHYERLSGAASQPFPGATEGLEAMRAQGLAIACITNKLMRFTVPLLAKAGIARHIQVISTSDTAGARKPDPAMVLHACKLLGVQPAQACVIGDSDNDGEAARAAGCRFVLVSYGYREGRALGELQCDARVDSLVEAAALLGTI
ncbi:MAG: phosphoglycolate phosphatase [Proteobacteria bacterium]|nr:phosphoglycolate phosphatase [Pseudomonadota bacterium]